MASHKLSDKGRKAVNVILQRSSLTGVPLSSEEAEAIETIKQECENNREPIDREDELAIRQFLIEEIEASLQTANAELDRNAIDDAKELITGSLELLNQMKDIW